MSEVETVETSVYNMDSPRFRAIVLSMAVLPFSVMWFLVTALFVALGFMFQNAVWPSQRGLYTIVFFTGAPFYLAVLFGSMAYRGTKRAFRRFRSIPGAGLYTCVFTPEKLDYGNEAGVSSSVPYRLMAKITPEPDGIQFMVDAARLLWVPRDAFATSEDFQTVSDWCLRAQLARASRSASVSGR